MKTKFVLIFLFLFFMGFSQKNKRTFPKSDLENEIGIEFNKYRKEYNDTIPQLTRLWILDSASKYHNDYLANINYNNPKNSFTFGHTEEKVMKGCVYTGTKPLLNTSRKRTKVYDKGDTLTNITEVIAVNNTINLFYRDTSVSINDIAKYVIKSWIDSPGHKSTLEMKKIHYFGVNVYVHKDNFIFVFLVVSSDFSKFGI